MIASTTYLQFRDSWLPPKSRSLFRGQAPRSPISFSPWQSHLAQRISTDSLPSFWMSPFRLPSPPGTPLCPRFRHPFPTARFSLSVELPASLDVWWFDGRRTIRAMTSATRRLLSATVSWTFDAMSTCPRQPRFDHLRRAASSWCQCIWSAQNNGYRRKPRLRFYQNGYRIALVVSSRTTVVGIRAAKFGPEGRTLGTGVVSRVPQPRTSSSSRRSNLVDPPSGSLRRSAAPRWWRQSESPTGRLRYLYRQRRRHLWCPIPEILERRMFYYSRWTTYGT